MINYFYTDTNGSKQGPVTTQQLQELVAQGIVGPYTPLETDGGHKGVAGQVPGLFAAASPYPQQQLYERHRTFAQKVAETFETRPESIPLSTPPLSRFTYIFLAVFVGIFGIHNFYAKRNMLGAIHVAFLAPWMIFLVFLASSSFLAGLGFPVGIDWLSAMSLENMRRSFGWMIFFFVVLPTISELIAMAQIVCITSDGIGREFERF